MFTSEFGELDGDKWESICQYSFKRKYEDESYQEIKASPGDFGLEGFTRNGKAFQCYCPDQNYSSKELNKKQTEKIANDLKKLRLYQKQLLNKLGSNCLIKQWFFVTPVISKNDIVDHCTKKTTEVIQWKLPIIDNENFQVVAVDSDFVRKYILEYLKGGTEKLIINTEAIEPSSRLQWQSTSISLIDNANRKHRNRFPDNVSDITDKVNKYTTITIDQYLNGKLIVDRLQKDYPQEYERFIKIVSQIEVEVEEKCVFNSGKNNVLYNEIKSLVVSSLTRNFNFLDEITIKDLTNYVVADWVLRCPIDFTK